MRLFHVDSSARSHGSSSRALTAHFVEEFRSRVSGLEVDYLDLATDPLPHVDELFTAAMFTPPPQRTEEMRNALRLADTVASRVMSSDAVLFGIPLYNFGLPSTFKAFLDQLVRPGVTHIPEPDGSITGKLGGLRAMVITTRGLDFSAGSEWEDMDGLLPNLRAIFKFTGLKNVSYVNAQPLLAGGEKRKHQVLADARDELSRIAEKWSLEVHHCVEVA